jgi:hypothetical protein
MKFVFIFAIAGLLFIGCDTNGDKSKTNFDNEIARIEGEHTNAEGVKVVEKIDINKVSVARRIVFYASALNRLVPYIQTYSDYIQQNGLFSDEVFDYLESQLKANPDFVKEIENRTGYHTTSDFLQEFRTFSKTYSYMTFSREVPADEINDYIRQIEFAEIQLTTMLENEELNSSQRLDLQTRLEHASMLKHRIEAFKKLQKEINPDVLNQVQINEERLLLIYAKLFGADI